MASRHIIRRALIGCRFSPDTAVIVFCRGSSCPCYEICAVEWSSAAAHFPLSACPCVSPDEDVNERTGLQSSL